MESIENSEGQEEQSKVSGTSILWLLLIVLVILVVGGGGGKAIQEMTTSTTMNASASIARISQDDSRQYASQAEYRTWSPSACSATSMTEVINAYGHTYQITDILQKERAAGQISVDQGLLYGASSIAATVKSFGFTSEDKSGSSLDSLISIANAGQPLLVSFPPPAWQGGHILVLRGGESDNVTLVDSSQYNITTWTRAHFLKYWRGWAVLVTPNDGVANTTRRQDQHDKAYYTDVARQDALAVGLDPALFIRQINQESGFQTDLISSTGDIGIAQFQRTTAAGMGINPYDPEASLKGAARLMAGHLKQFQGDYAKALAAYNAGYGTVQRAVAQGGANWKQYLPLTTQHYINVIVG